MTLKNYKFNKYKKGGDSIFEDGYHLTIRRTTKAGSLLSKVCIQYLGTYKN